MPSSQSQLLLPILTEPPPTAAPSESLKVQKVIDFLHLQPHTEGGYFVETDRDSFRIPNPFLNDRPSSNGSTSSQASEQTKTRTASTTIFYYITKGSPFGAFHSNKARTIHTLHWGRGRYVIIHADEAEKTGQKARTETFVVGKNLLAGENLQWIVEGGVYKSSFLLPDEKEGTGDEDEGLLISEVIPCSFTACLQVCHQLKRSFHPNRPSSPGSNTRIMTSYPLIVCGTSSRLHRLRN